MNLLTHYTKNNLALQTLFSSSKEKMCSILPDNLDCLLQQSGCVKWFRGISSPMDLLWGTLLYAVSGMSFSLLSTAMAALGITSILDTAWKKRFSSLSPPFFLCFYPTSSHAFFLCVRKNKAVVLFF